MSTDQVDGQTGRYRQLGFLKRTRARGGPTGSFPAASPRPSSLPGHPVLSPGCLLLHWALDFMRGRGYSLPEKSSLGPENPPEEGPGGSALALFPAFLQGLSWLPLLASPIVYSPQLSQDQAHAWPLWTFSSLYRPPLTRLIPGEYQV